MTQLRPVVWSSGQSSCLQIQRSGFDSRLYQIFWEVLGLERGPLSLVNTTEELLERKSRGSGLENRDYGLRGSVVLTMRHPSIRRVTSTTSGGRSVGIVRSRTKATEFLFVFFCLYDATPWENICYETLNHHQVRSGLRRTTLQFTAEIIKKKNCFSYEYYRIFRKMMKHWPERIPPLLFRSKYAKVEGYGGMRGGG
jgi:hypothetical protein